MWSKKFMVKKICVDVKTMSCVGAESSSGGISVVWIAGRSKRERKIM